MRNLNDILLPQNKFCWVHNQCGWRGQTGQTNVQVDMKKSQLTFPQYFLFKHVFAKRSARALCCFAMQIEIGSSVRVLYLLFDFGFIFRELLQQWLKGLFEHSFTDKNLSPSLLL